MRSLIALSISFEAIFALYLVMAGGNNQPAVSKRNFLTTLEKDYGYNGLLDEIRKKDLHNLNDTYLDYTGAGIYRTSQMREIFKMLENDLYANPHSASPASSRTTDLVEEARDLVMKFTNADPNEYSIIFTASATSSLKLLGESFPWSENSLYLYTRDNHNSVLGIRRWAKHFSAKFKAVDQEEIDQLEGRPVDRTAEGPYNLFAFPAEENFAGKKFDLGWIQKFRTTSIGEHFNKGKWFVLLDAAAYIPTNRLDLKRTPADFVVLSFYKIFGYPNLGALIVRNDALKYLEKRDFSGGTVVIATCGTDYALFQPRGCVKFEDGTLPFFSIIALKEGFKKYHELGADRINKHVWAVTRELYTRLSRIRHNSTGRPVVKIYGNHMRNDPTQQGGIVTINILNSTGGYVGYNNVMKHAAAENINIRVGCFCNPGSCISAAGLQDDQVEDYYGKKTSCHDSIDIINGVPLGAVRISLGPYTTMEDIETFDQFVRKYYVE